MNILRSSALILATVSASFAPDEGDEQYQFIYGLYEKGLHELVVKEAGSFLREFSGHEKRDLARYRLASSLFELEQHDDAAREFRQLSTLDAFEFEAEVWFRLGQCDLELGRYDSAATALEAVVALETDYLIASATFLLGEARFQLGDYERAALHYAWVVREDADGEHVRDAVYGLTWCAFRQEKHAESASRIRTFLERWPDDPLAPELKHLLGEAELAAGRPAEALTAFRSVPDGAFREAALHGSGFANAALDDHVAAARSFRTLLDEHPTSRFAGEAVLHLGIHLFESGAAADALAAFDRPQAVESAELLYWKARAQVQTGAREPALASLERARVLAESGSPLAERIHLLRGDVLFELGRADEATAAYGQSTSEYALHAAAAASFNDGRLEEAVRLARDLVERFPDGTYAVATRVTLGEALFALGRHDEAEAAFRAVAASDAEPERRASALLRAGWCAYLRGDVQVAATTFAEVSSGFPSYERVPEALFMEGRAREELGQADLARRALSRYLERERLGEHAPSALLALARLESGPRGMQHLEALIAEHPGSEQVPPALYELAERRAAAGEHAAARDRFRELVRGHPGDALVTPSLYGEAWACYSLEEFGAAASALRKLVDRGDGSDELVVGALELWIFAADRLDRADEAAAAWESFRTRCQDEGRLLACARVVAGTLRREGQGAEARRLIGRLLDTLRQPAAIVAARVESAWMALSAEDLDAAELDVSEALAVEGGDDAVLEAAFFVGEARYDAGDDEEAARMYAIATRDGSPVADRALYKEGFVHLRSGDPKAAAAAFGALVDRFPSSDLFGETLFLFGEALFRAGQHAEAVPSFQRLLRELPEHDSATKARYRLGVSLCQLERWAEAEVVLTELARKAPEFSHGVEAELWRGRALAAQDKGRSARQALQRVVARDDGVLAARARIALGKLSMAEDDVEAALSEFLKVALLYAHDDEVAEALLLSGTCLEAKGQVEKAREQYREILDRHSESSSAAEARRRLDG